MSRKPAYERTMMRALGTSVLAVFVLGFTSGPLRSCVSHPGHAPAQHAHESVPDAHAGSHHATQTDDGPTPPHSGCSCLGVCSVEQAPYLPVAYTPTPAYVPTAPKTISWVSGRTHAKRDQLDVPLARPPPVV
jgi:hypothetical protein